MFNVDTGGKSGGYNEGIDKIGDAVVSCNIKVSKGSVPSLKRRIASPQSPLLPPHSEASEGVVIEASTPSGEIQFIIQGIEFSVILVREVKRAEDVLLLLFRRDNKRCVGPESVVENHGVVVPVVVAVVSESNSEMRGASSKGVLATVAFVHD